MTYLIKLPIKTLLSALALSTVNFLPAFANTTDIGFTPLPDIPVDQIAVDVERKFDVDTGMTVMIAPTFDPFEADPNLAGTASLRTGSSSISIDGAPVSGGAYLDLSMIYTSGSNDPFDIRGFDRAVYIAGDPVMRIKQDVKTLDCSENVREVTYDEGYHRGSSYGYLAGLYVLLPRYRGHRGFGRGYGHHRYRPYGYGGFGRSLDRETLRRDRRRDDHSGRGHRRDRDDRVRRDPGDRDDRRRRRPYTDETDYTVRPGDRDRTARPDRPRRSRDGRETRREKKKDKIVPIYRPRTNPDSERTRRVENNRGDRGTRRERRSREDRSTERHRRVDRPRSVPSSRPHTSRPNISNPTPRPQTQPQTQPRSKPRKERVKPVSRPKPSRVDRATDRTFKTRHNGQSKRRVYNFYPTSSGYSRTDVYTSYRCVREEKVVLHIPQDRLEAARFDGLTIVLLDQAGQDVPVYLPSNYVQGFLQASQGYIPSQTYQSPQIAPSQSSQGGAVSPYPLQTAPTREMIGGYPQN